MSNVEILRHPTEEDWQRCKMLALNTIGKRYTGSEVTDDWKHDMLRSPHSPKRTLMFTIRMEVPYWVSVHFVRHKFGVEHFVTSQRNDRQSKYDRNEAPQSAPVVHIMDINAEALIHMANMRMCCCAATETRQVMTMIANEVVKTNPEFIGLLVPKCLAHNGCDEFRPCGFYERAIGAIDG